MTAIRHTQALEALELANRARLARCDLKRQIRAGTLTAYDILRTLPDASRNMSILELLQSQHQWGRARALKLIRAAALSESRRLGELSTRQRYAVARLVAGERDTGEMIGWWPS